jgi:biopolymer transport protein ExbB/TolQ
LWHRRTSFVFTMPRATTMMHSSAMSVEPSSLEVDYDVNITPLYQAICNCDWDLAVQHVKTHPHEARTWVVRHYEGEEKEIMWRFLPIHSACARDPPANVISALLKAYPEGSACVDDQGMYALHYACGNQASREVIRLLLVANSMAAKCADPRGMLPIHYLACWGPSSVSIIDMVMVANRDVGKAQDYDGNTPLDLAMEGDYPERNAVVSVLKRWLEKSSRQATPTAEKSRKRIESSSSNFVTTPTADEAAAAAAAVVTVPQHPEDEENEEEEEEEQPVTPSSSRDHDNDEAPPPPPSTSRNVETPSSRTPLSVSTAVEDNQDDYFEVKIMASIENEEQAPPPHHPKEEMKANTTLTSSPRAVSRLQAQVSQLKLEKQTLEAAWEEKLKSSVQELDERCSELMHHVDELKLALDEANTKISVLEQEARDKNQVIMDTESQLTEALERLEQMEQENANLKQDIDTLEQDNVELTKGRDNHNERLQSMSVALQSMMERQDVIMQSVNDKNAQLMEASQARRQNLKMLFDMEHEFMEAVMGDESPDFEKQMKEMQALTAIVEAMKD